MFLRRLLRSEEYEVFEAVNGKEGLDQLEVMDESGYHSFGPYDAGNGRL